MKKTIIIFLICLSLTITALWAVSRKNNQGSQQLIVFHAGSLTVPFKMIFEEFTKTHPKTKILSEAAGSRICARKISDLHKPCDIIASADYTVIDNLLIPQYAQWNIKFATNEMVLAYSKNARSAEVINKENWLDILQKDDISFGRSDPDSDPCGYRAVLTILLAEKFYNKPGIADKLLTKDKKYIRPKEVDLLALLETGQIDYIFIYRSVAQQHNLGYLTLPDKINLKNYKYADFYKSASVKLVGKKPGQFITKTGKPIVYGMTIPFNAPNRKLALEFAEFLLSRDKGGDILQNAGQDSVVPSATKTFNNIPESLKPFALPAKQENTDVIAGK